MADFTHLLTEKYNQMRQVSQIGPIMAQMGVL
jgi:hypothetical protein